MSLIPIYRLLAIVGAFLVGFWLPLRLIGFVPPIMIEIIFDFIISGISLLNIYLHFYDEEINPRKIKNWFNLSVMMDLVCVVPLSMFAFVFYGETVEWLLILNLLTVRHIRHIRDYLDGFPSMQPIFYRLIPVFLTLPLLVHLVACGWIALGSGSADISADSSLQIYVKAIYWSFTTLTTVGYGDIVARTSLQMLYVCCIQVMGVGVFGFILSNVASLLARSDAARENHMNNLDKVETFMKLHHIPDELKGSIRKYYHYVWMNKKGYQENLLLEGLPAKIQSELLMHINRGIVSKVPFLKGADPELLGQLMTHLKGKIFVPGEKIFQADEVGDSLYFIQSGQVDIIARDGVLLGTLSDGSFFGEIALISDKPRTATARASTYCDVYVLQRKDFQAVTKAHPIFRQHLEKIMRERQAS